jgi:hypothetical protein
MKDLKTFTGKKCVPKGPVKLPRYQLVGTVPVHAYEKQCCAFYIATTHVAEADIILYGLAR